MMNKAKLINEIAQGADISNAAAECVLNSFINRVVNVVTNGEDLRLIGFGSFKSVTRSARTGRNPATGAEIQIPASKSVKFTVGKAFLLALNADVPIHLNYQQLP